MENLDTKICPICGRDNKCMHNKDCWCMEKEIPQQLIARVPLDKRDKACICEACVDAFNKEKS
nr:cysteine-rich CWC family protein [Tissierella sp.]